MFTSEIKLSDACKLYDEYLDSVIKCTLVDYEDVIKFRENLTRKAYRFQQCVNAASRWELQKTRAIRREIEAKAEKVMEAAHDASMTTYDGKVNSIWLTKLYELGLRG